MMRRLGIYGSEKFRKKAWDFLCLGKGMVTWLFLGFCILFLGCSLNPESAGRAPRALDGILDLTDWSFQKDGIVKLDGNWEFYWEQLITPEGFTSFPPPCKTGWIDVPSVWNTFRKSHVLLPKYGYATYRLTVQLPPSSETKALNVVLISTAYSLWVDGKKILTNGTVGVDKLSMVPLWKPSTASFTHPGGTVEIVVQVSNFMHRRGGIRHSIVMGTELQIRQAREERLFWEHISFGCLCIMGLYHFGLFLFRRNDSSFLYFSLFCLVIVLRTATTGSHLMNMYTDFSWASTIRIEYLSFYGCIPILTLFLNSLYPKENTWIMVRLSVFVGILFYLVVLFTPAHIYSRTLSAYQALSFLYGLYFVLVLGLAVFRKRTGAMIFFLGFLALTAAGVNDILYSRMIIFTGSYGHLGFLFFLASQAYLLLQRYAKAFYTSEKLSKKLEESVIHLEDTVEKRTRELKSAYDTIKLISIKDALTDCYNRRYLDEQLAREAALAHRYQRPFSIILCDIDYFKQINDDHGHPVGDQVLVEFSAILKAQVRQETDWVCRYGGEEFLIILPQTQKEPAVLLAQRIRKKIEENEFCKSPQIIRLSASFGVSEFLIDNKDISQGVDDLLNLADKRLYVAKHKGRNRVIF